jgi:hypothetical protein
MDFIKLDKEKIDKNHENIHILIDLRLKELSEKITLKELLKLFNIEIFLFQKENPPLEKYFDPYKEIENLKKIKDKQEKIIALTEFKDKLIRQRKAISKLSTLLERLFILFPGIPKEIVEKLIGSFSEKYGFSDNLKKIFENFLSKYYSTREDMLNLRKQFPDDKDLLYKLTNIKLEENEKIKIYIGPLSFDIYGDMDVINKIYHSGGGDKNEIIRGSAKPIQIEDKLFYRVLIVIDEYYKKTKIHEYHHVKFKIFKEIFQNYIENRNIEKIQIENLNRLEDLNEKEKFLKKYLNIIRNKILEEAKNELMAKVYPVKSDKIDDIKKEIDKFLNLYDFLTPVKENLIRNYSEFSNLIEQELEIKYKKIVNKAIDSYLNLIQKGHYKTEEANALLFDIPLKDWPKTVKRILEIK